MIRYDESTHRIPEIVKKLKTTFKKPGRQKDKKHKTEKARIINKKEIKVQITFKKIHITALINNILNINMINPQLTRILKIEVQNKQYPIRI